MSNLLLGTVAIVGTRPLMWHAFTADSIPLTKKERTGVAGNDPHEWRKTVLQTPTGQLYLPPMAIFSCLTSGAQFTRRGRGTLQRTLAATLQLTDDQVLVDRHVPDPLTTDPTQPVYLDIRSVRNPTTKARNIRYRVAASANWQASFTLLWDRSVVSRNEIHAILIDSGRLVGLGSGRSIGFGRFHVRSIETIEAQEVAFEPQLS